MTNFTRENYEDLTKAIAEGVHKVKYQDKEVEYRSLKDMLALQERMAAELGIFRNNGSKRTVGVFVSGL